MGLLIMKIKNLIREFKLDVKNLKKLILEKKANQEDISYLKVKTLIKLLQVIIK